MKRILLIATTLFSLNASAQVTFEHTYTDMTGVYQLEDEGSKYSVTDQGAKQIKLYNADHSLWKTINLNLPGNATNISPYYISTKLFNTDSKVEFVLYYTLTAGSTNVPNIAICDENGNLSNSWSNYSIIGMNKVDGKWKFLILKNGTKDVEVYGLPGNYITAVRKVSGETLETQLYPNPVETSATLKYSLADGTSKAELSIYNSMGQKLRDYTITSDYQSIIIEKGNLPAGNYIYKISAPGYNTEGERFVIR